MHVVAFTEAVEVKYMIEHEGYEEINRSTFQGYFIIY